MTRIVIILDADGVFQGVYGDSEVDLKILKQGQDDAKIDKTEAEMEPLE